MNLKKRRVEHASKNVYTCNLLQLLNDKMMRLIVWACEIYVMLSVDEMYKVHLFTVVC